MNQHRCPTCGRKIEEVKDERTLLHLKRSCKFPDEDVWYCSRCKEFLYEEDLLFTEVE